jgi:hypothetical protein
MRMGRIAFIIILALAPAWAQAETPAGAAPDVRPEQADRMKFEWVRETGDCRTSCRAWIAASGRLTDTTVADFEAFTQGLDVRGATVVLESAGGLVDAGLDLGRAFRRLGMTTTVGRTVRGAPEANGERRATLSPRATCASMCVFALIGGVRRHVPDEARVLVHQIWPGKLREDALAGTYTAGHIVRIQREAGQIARHTVEMGADIELFEVAMRIPPWEALRPLSRDELRRMRVHNSDKAFGIGAVAVASAVAGEETPIKVALPASTGEPSRGWSMGHQDGRTAASRRMPLTVEGQEIGSFRIALACGQAPDTYQLAYDEKRVATGGDRIAGVRLTIQRETVPLRIESSAMTATDLVSVAQGSVTIRMAQALSAPEPPSLLLETLTLGKRPTAIRVGPAGLADALRDLAATCRR